MRVFGIRVWFGCSICDGVCCWMVGTTGRVFVSHTSELAEWPQPRTYVQAVLDAVGAADLQGVDMRYFAAGSASCRGLSTSGPQL